MAFGFAVIGLASNSAGPFITPGLGPSVPHWNDTAGHRIEAHSAGMFLDEPSKRWFWYGESKKTSSLADHGVNAYSAPSVAGPWRFEGQVIGQKDLPMTIAGQSGPWIIERPKVLFNSATGKYVCWFHLDTAGYKFRHSAVFEAARPQGPFSFVHALQPDGVPSLDVRRPPSCRDAAPLTHACR